MHVARSLALLLAVALAGCGDEKSSALSTGVDRNKPLGTVTPSEAQAICTATQMWTNQAITSDKQQQVTCRVTSNAIAALSARPAVMGAPPVTDAQLQMTCQTAYDTCIMRPAPAPAPSTAAPTCQAFPASCTATVAEYETCLNDVPPFLDMTLAMLPTCQTLTRLSILSVLNLPNTLPASCKTFQSKCAGVPIGGIPPTGGMPMP
jgi:hypothetical protein